MIDETIVNTGGDDTLPATGAPPAKPVRNKSRPSRPAAAGLAEIDQFLLLEKLGEGSAGKVYKARDVESGVEVAVKGLPVSVSEAVKAAIKANFQIVTNLNHPNIAAAKEYHVIRSVRYLSRRTEKDFAVRAGDALLVMQFAKGETLREWRKAQGAIRSETLLAIVRQIASALDEAHRQGVIHRDVKPANINIHQLPGGGIEVKLLDFGIATEGPAKGIAGTVAYMAPEQASGAVQTKAVDIYSLGKIALELATGSAAPESLKLLDSAPRAAIERALSVDPSLRHASAGEFAADLESAIMDGGVKLPPEYRELMGVYNAVGLSPGEKFDALADALKSFAAAALRVRKVETTFYDDWDRYRYLFTDAALLKRLDLIRSRRNRRRRNPSEILVTEATWRGAFRAVCEGVEFLAGAPMPEPVRAICAQIEYPPEAAKPPRGESLKSLELAIERIEDGVFYASEVDGEGEELRVDPVECGVPFALFKKTFRAGDKVLVANPIEIRGVWRGSGIVLEPDFLFSPQALGRASVWNRGSLMFLLNVFSGDRPKSTMMLGNMGDECLAEEVAGGERSMNELTSEFIRANAIDAVQCEIDENWRKEAADIRDNIHHEITGTLKAEFGVDAGEWQIEAPFVSPHLGMVGRMDAFRPAPSAGERTVVLELKCGKWNTFPAHHPKAEHLFQPWIYSDMLYYTLGIARGSVWPRIFYARSVPGSNGRAFAVPALRENIRKVVNFRNTVVNVWRLMRENKLRDWFDGGQIRPEIFRASDWGDKLWEGWLKGRAEELVNPILRADELAKDYFWRFLAFEAAEDVFAWCGDGGASGGGASLAWKMSLQERRETGAVLSSLAPVAHSLDKLGRVASVDFDLSQEKSNLFSALREGDAVLLYEQTDESSSVVNSRLFGAYVDSFKHVDGAERIRVCLDPPQTETVFAPAPEKRYIVEGNIVNRSRSEYKGLHMFLSGCKRRRRLLLNQVAPAFGEVRRLRSGARADVKEIVERARAAKDYFLVWGPPGTGKTSHLLRLYVDEAMATPGENLLMLAYTNRAVDEICDMLERAGHDYWRIGSIARCKAKYRKHMPGSGELEFENRVEFLAAFEKTRIVVGTIASLGAGNSILHLGKHFDSAIVDEASQILEPQMLSLFCAPSPGNADEPLIGKFVFVGDDKQLPAVVLQPSSVSEVSGPSLRAIHLVNCRNSLFMRLRRLSGERKELFGRLAVQFRMHRDIAAFPAKYFYGDLALGDETRQSAPLPPPPAGATPFERAVLSTRLGFVPVVAPEPGKNAKSNDAEARVCAGIVRVLLEKSGARRLEPKDIGVIVPFRSQIAAIRNRLGEKLAGRFALDDLMIDTVERYQGSERAVIVFSTVVSRQSQLDALSPCDDAFRTIESDKKLNVAVTRAREQFFLVGERRLLEEIPSYKALVSLAAHLEIGD